MKRCSKSLVIREVHNNIPLPAKQLVTPRAGEDEERLELTRTAVRNVKCTATLENSLAAIQKLNIHLPDDSAIQLWDIYPREMKVYIHTKTCSTNLYSGFIYNCQKLEIFKIGKWIFKNCSEYTVKYYSVIFAGRTAFPKATLALSDWSDLPVAFVNGPWSILEFLRAGEWQTFNSGKGRQPCHFTFLPSVWLTRFPTLLGAPSVVPAVSCGWAHGPCDRARQPRMFAQEGHLLWAQLPHCSGWCFASPRAGGRNGLVTWGQDLVWHFL